MPNYAQLAEDLTRALDTALAPIAISLLDEPPAGVAAFEGAVPAGCVFWERAAAGPFYTSATDHELCAIGVHTHHLSGASAQQPSELERVLEVMGQLDYVRGDDVARIAVLDRVARHAVYAPLAQAPCKPDMVILFVNSQDGLVVAEAVDQVEHGPPPALGRPACALVPHVINTGRAASSLGCCGARAYLDVMQPSIAMWGLPGARLADYVARIVALSDANAKLARFHQLRRQDVEGGGRPTVEASLEHFARG
jgi:uncharacterized protein (DUF169 family)